MDRPRRPESRLQQATAADGIGRTGPLSGHPQQFVCGNSRAMGHPGDAVGAAQQAHQGRLGHNFFLNPLVANGEKV